jgi:hypothetical protein
LNRKSPDFNYFLKEMTIMLNETGDLPWFNINQDGREGRQEGARGTTTTLLSIFDARRAR